MQLLRRLFCQVDKAGRKVHDDALVFEVDGVEPGFDEGDQGGLGSGRVCVRRGQRDFQQGSGIGEAGAAVGRHGVFDAGDLTDGSGSVEELAADEIADEPRVGFKWRQV